MFAYAHRVLRQSEIDFQIEHNLNHLNKVLSVFHGSYHQCLYIALGTFIDM